MHGLLPSRPGAMLPCLPSPSYFRPPRFPFYSSCSPPPRLPLVGFRSTPPVTPPFPIPLDTTHGGCAALPTPRCLILVPPHHGPLGCFEDLPRLFASVDHRVVSTPNTKGASSVDPSVARNSLRSSTMHPRQVYNSPLGLGFSPPAIVPNIARLGSLSLLCRATAPEKKSRRLRMVVWMLSQRVIMSRLLRPLTITYWSSKSVSINKTTHYPKNNRQVHEFL